MMFITPFPFNLFHPFVIIGAPLMLIHNWSKHDNAVGFEISPKFRWLYKEKS